MRSHVAVSLGLAACVVAAACGSGGKGVGTGSSQGDPSGSGQTTGSGSGSTTSGAGGASSTTGGGGAAGTGGATHGAGGAATTTTTGQGGAATTTGAATTGAGGSGGGMCAPGTADCNHKPGDGCEVFTDSNVKNCGKCGNACPPGPNTPALCAAGMCGLACPMGTRDCNHDPKDGCETNLLDDAKNCGACGMDCMGAACVQGACACAAETQTAQLVPLDMYIMLDQSGSMSDAVNGGGTKWSAVTAALQGFFNDPKSAGIGVGIQYFALASGGGLMSCVTDADCGGNGPCFFGICLGGGAGGDSCNVADYAKPEVEIAPLNAAQATALSNSIGGHMPSTSTPTAPALQGAIQHAQAWEMANPTHVSVVVFVTDGDPTECAPMDIPSIAAIAAAGVNGPPSVKTFVIGVGPSLANLNAIAAGGGTGMAFLVDINANVEMQFQAALAALQGNAVGCTYKIPKPKMGQIDFNKVNVQFTPGNGAPKLIANVANLGACDPNTGGWYYDNAAMPTQIILCPSSCATAQADPASKIDILLGCQTTH